MAEQSENTVTRTQKQEGADAIMDKVTSLSGIFRK